MRMAEGHFLPAYADVTKERNPKKTWEGPSLAEGQTQCVCERTNTLW